MTSEPIVRVSPRPRGERRRATWGMSLLALATLAGLVVVPFMLLSPRADQYTLRTYETAVVQVGPMVEYVRVAGRLVPGSQRSVMAPASSTLIEWLASEGELVNEGQVLGRLDSPDLVVAVERAREDRAAALRHVEELELAAQVEARAEEARMAEREAERAAARRDLDVTAALYEIGAASANELAGAQTAASRAEAALASAAADQQDAARAREIGLVGARAAFTQADSRLAQATGELTALEIRSPIDGQLVHRGAEAGAAVAAGEALATIAGTREPRVEADLPEAQARSVGVGQPAVIQLAGQSLPATVVGVAPRTETAADGGTVVPVTLAIVQPTEGLRVGASATIEIEVGRLEDALFLPRGPYLTTGGERFAFVVAEDRARRQVVVFGLTDGNRIEVRSGLEAGQRVIVSSYEAFKEREEIRLVPTGEIGRPAGSQPDTQEEP